MQENEVEQREGTPYIHMEMQMRTAYEGKVSALLKQLFLGVFVASEGNTVRASPLDSKHLSQLAPMYVLLIIEPKRK